MSQYRVQKGGKVRRCLGSVCMLALLLMTGCGDDSEGASGSGGGAGMSTARRIVRVDEWSPVLGLVGPLEKVKICATDTSDCAWTNREGRATVQIPLDDEFSFTFEKQGYGKDLLAGFESEGPYLFPLMSLQEEGGFYDIHEEVGSPYPMEGTGTILIVPVDGLFSITSTGCSGVAGRTFLLSEGEGKPFYVDEQGYWDATLTATSCWGWGGFTEVPPGEVQVEIGGRAENCQVLDGWPGRIDNSVRMPVRTGFLTEVRVDCDVPN